MKVPVSRREFLQAGSGVAGALVAQNFLLDPEPLFGQ
jgi:hypothetical protein